MAAIVGAAYLLLSQYVIWLNDPVNAGAGYWPAAGVTVAAVLVVPARRWGWIAGAVLAAEIAGSSMHGYPLSAVVWWAAANALEPFVAVLLLRRLGRTGRLAPLPELVWFLVAAVVVGPLVGALVGSVGTSRSFDRAWLDIVVRWWVGDGLGVLVVAPLLLCVREPRGRRRSPLEGVALAVMVVVVPLLAFQGWSQDWDVVFPYLVFPLLMWASVRFGLRGAAVAGFGVAQVANLTTALGYGPFHAAADSDGHRVAVLQVFLGAALTAGLTIATFVSDALLRTRIYARQRSTADALQDAILPDHLPAVPGVQLAARYVPATNDAAIHIGGDWYDAFQLPDGAIALAIGDIAGHDLDAAVAMAQVRNGLHSLLFDSADPARALTALDRQLASDIDGPTATAICAVYEQGRLTWANAGHPPLLLAAADGTVRYLDEDPDPMLGIGAASYVTRTLTLEHGDTVVGFTDGLIEHRSWSLDEAFAHLARVVATAPERRPEALCDLLLTTGLGGRSRDDDTCMLVLRCSADPAEPDRRKGGRPLRSVAPGT